MVPGSYANGFAPRDYEPEHPGLWSGCIGAWCPGLGPTGSRLPDWSGFGNAGTLTNFTLNTAWGYSRGRPSLTWTASNSHVSLGTHPRYDSGADPFTIAAWVRPTQVTGFATILARGNFSDGYEFRINSSGALQYVAEGPGVNINGGAFTINTWHHVAVTRLGNVFTMYLDARSVGTQTLSVTIANTADTRIGYRSDNNLAWIGQIDDVRFYNRPLTPSELTTLATDRGIAYMPRRVRSLYLPQATGNRRRRLLIGA